MFSLNEREEIISPASFDGQLSTCSHMRIGEAPISHRSDTSL